MKVPFVDLGRQYLDIKEDIDSSIQSVIREAAFIGGKYVKHFENLFADYLSMSHCISCANGTDSIEIILTAMGIGQGDEVIVPALSWFSTAEAVSNVGAKPVFVDVNVVSRNIDVESIESSITKRTKAIIPVHLYGNPADMDIVMMIAKKYNLFVIEDCAQAHGAQYKGVQVGTIGHAASFSFYPGKNLGAYGDAGAIVTNDNQIAAVCRQIANHGQEKKHNHLRVGRNSRLDGIHASILSAKLPYLEKWNSERIRVARLYDSLLSPAAGKPAINNIDRHVFHLYVISVSKRDALAEYLSRFGIDTAIHYPTPLPMLKPYISDIYENQFPNAVKLTNSILSLPIFPELRNEEVEYVALKVNAFIDTIS